MKIAGYFLLSVAFILTEAKIDQEYIDTRNKYQNECIKETKLEKQLLSKFLRGENVDDEALKQQALCIAKKYGSMTADGEFDTKISKEVILPIVEDETVADNLVKKCNIKKTTPQDSAFYASQCYVKLFRQGFFAKEKLRKEVYAKECTEKTHVKKEKVIEFGKGVSSDDPAIREYALCMTLKYGTLKENGDFDMDLVSRRLFDLLQDGDEVERIIKTCIVKKDSPKETAYWSGLCYFQKMPKFEL